MVYRYRFLSGSAKTGEGESEEVILEFPSEISSGVGFRKHGLWDGLRGALCATSEGEFSTSPNPRAQGAATEERPLTKTSTECSANPHLFFISRPKATQYYNI